MPSAKPYPLIRLIVLALSLSLGVPAANAGFDELPAQLDELVKQGLMPGAVTLVARNDELLHQSVVGYQDLESGTPMALDTLFRWYSMSKPVTSVAILLLAEENQLNLDDPLEKFFPAFADARVYVSGGLDDMVTEPLRRSITLEDLLTHSSGITYHFTGSTPVHQYYRKHGVKRDTPVGSLPDDGPPARDLDELLQRLAQAPLLHQPGERFSYSYSTTVLGAVIEKVSGQRLDRFLQQRIFQPLGMSDSGFFVQGADLSRFVSNYAVSDDGLLRIEWAANTDYADRDRLLDGGGALAGTAADYLKFASMLANAGRVGDRQFLRPESVARLFQPLIETSGQGISSGFGLGFALGDQQTEAAHYMPAGTAGWSGSGNTFFWVNPDTGTAVVFMTQVIGAINVPFRRLVMEAMAAESLRQD